jgi:hypothetical protein
MSTDVLRNRRVQVDTVLSTLSIGIKADQQYIGDLLLPPLPQDLDEAVLAKLGNEAFAMVDDLVDDWATPRAIDTSRDKLKITVDGHALTSPIGRREQLVAAKGPFRYDLAARKVYTVKSVMLNRREYLQAALIQNSGVYPVANVVDLVAAKFSNNAIDPIPALALAVQDTAFIGIGQPFNTFWIASDAWFALVANTKVTTRIYGTVGSQPATVTQAQIASLLGVDRVIVGRAVLRDKAGVGTRIWTGKAGLLYVPPTSGEEIPAFGYTVEQRVFGSATEYVTVIDEPLKGAAGVYHVKRGAFYTPAVTFNAAGILYINVI